MGLIDRAIGLFSPSAAARREEMQLKRQATKLKGRIIQDEMQKRTYQGASKGRRMAHVKASTLSAEDVLRQGGAVLRDRCRDLIRNNPHAANIVQKHVDNIVGDGIVPKAIASSPDRGKEIDKLFKSFSKECDPERLIDFYGIQARMVRGMVSVGEHFLRARFRRLSDGLAVPLQLQVLVPEFLDDARQVPSRAGDNVRSGIQFDKIGGRRGYWMFTQNPRSAVVDSLLGRDSHFVPAAEVAHLFEVRESTRGEPWLAPVITRLYDIDDYDGSERLRKKIEACNVGVITPAEGSEEDDENPDRIGQPVQMPVEPRFDEDGVEIEEEIQGEPWPLIDRYGEDVERMEPGSFYYARGGAKVEFNTPASSNGYDTYMRTSLRGVSAGARLPYELMAADLSEVSFASGRMGTVEYRKFVTDIQWLFVVPMLCQPVWDWFILASRLAGLIGDDEEVGVEWTAPAFQSITPIDDSNADLKDVRSGFMSWDEAVTKRGGDPDRTAQQIADRNRFWDQNRIMLDSDPRVLSLNGQMHPAPSSPGTEGDPDAAGEQDREARGITGREGVRPHRASQQPEGRPQAPRRR